MQQWQFCTCLPLVLFQKQVNAGEYGPAMPELEKQIAEHNILQKEIEAYSLQIKNLHGPVRCLPFHSTSLHNDHSPV